MKTRKLKGKLFLGANFDRVRLHTSKWIYDFADIFPPLLDKEVELYINENCCIILSTKGERGWKNDL